MSRTGSCHTRRIEESGYFCYEKFRTISGAEPWAARAGPGAGPSARGRYRRPEPLLGRLREIGFTAIYLLSYVVD